MDAIISSALEELCSAGPTGITLPLLFSRLAPSISLSLTPSVKQSIWINLLAVPSLTFLDKSLNQPIPTSDIQSLKDAENIDLSIVANESLRDCFVGVYDLKARDGFKGFNADMRNTLQLLASARGNGITQSQLAREFGKGGNGIFYTLKNLESWGLVTRQTAVVHTSQEGNMDHKTAVTTNMVYLSRYAKMLGSQQRLEINQEKRSRCGDSECGMNEEFVVENVSVMDYGPAMKAICDKLAAADEKELFVIDIKQALGYGNKRACKVWINVCQRLIDAGLVKEYAVIIDNKTVVRLKLLREFSEKYFKSKYSEAYTEDWNVDQANQNSSAISEQLVELPLENQIYDMIDAAGSKGLTLVELCDRLGIEKKRYYNTFISIFSRYGMPYREEGHKKSMVYRVWTSRNLTADLSNTNLGLQADDSASRDAVADNVSETWDPTCNDRVPTNADEDNTAGKVKSLNTSTRIDLFERSESGNEKGMDFFKGDTDQQLMIVDMENVTDNVTSESIPRPTTVSLGKLHRHKDPSLAAKREQRILARLEIDKFIVRAELRRWLESLETDKHSAMDSKTLNRLLGKLQEQGLCKYIKFGKYVVLHPSIPHITPEIAGQIRKNLRFREQECRTRVKKNSEDDLPILEAKLCKRLENADPEAKLSVKDSEKIAEEIDPAAQQVLAYMNKGMNRDQIRSTNVLEDIMDQFEHPKSHGSSSRKRQRHPKSADSADHDGCTNKCNTVYQFVKDENSFAGHKENQSSGSMAHLENRLSEENSKPPHVDVGEDKHHPLSSQSLYQTRKKGKTRVSWHPEAERHLVIQYARYRAARGSRFHSVIWTALENLPAPPKACMRRMALLNGKPDFRTALMNLLNILGNKYVKYLEKGQCKRLTYCNRRTTVRDLTSPEPLEEGGDVEEKWDDFDCEDIKTALDEVLQHTQVSKLQKDDEGQRNKKRQRKNFNGNQGRARIPGKLVKALSKEARGCKQIYESLAVSNAVELFKLLFMSTLAATEVPNFMEMWRKYSEQDLFAAFKYLREKKILVGGIGGTSFELSQCFSKGISASPFPADTGERASFFYNWIQEKENDLHEEGIDLIPDLECGGILELFSRVATGELSVTPCLPDDGVGEPEESINLKRQADNGDLSNERKAKRPKRSSVVESELISRREKGFPGVKVIINRTVFSSASTMGGIPYMKNWNGDDKHHQEGHEPNSNLIPLDSMVEVLTRSHTNHAISDLNASPWEAMVEYAACLTSKFSDQTFESAFHSKIFKDIYEAIKIAGDQGLTLNEISDFIDKQGKSLGVENARIAIEILQSFGLTIQVNAYDTVHVVESQRRSKYFLTCVTGPSSGLQHPSKYQDANASTDLVTLKDRHAANNGSEFPTTETGVDNSHAHSVTILDAPAVVPLSSNENLSTHGNTWINICSASSGSYVPILPWMNVNGTINNSIYKGLVRRVVGSIMQNPGMLEGDIIQRMDVLNPQSCRRLLELLILEKHLIVRRMRQVRAGQAPSILGCLLKKRPSEDVVWREHFFVNPASSHLL